MPKKNIYFSILITLVIANTCTIGFILYNQIKTHETLDFLSSKISQLKTHQVEGTKSILAQFQKKDSILSSNTYKIEPLNSVQLGNPSATVSITMWTDFQCPFCAKSAPVLKQLLDKYPNDVKFTIKNYPLRNHKQALDAAKYALAAHNQGAYLEMYNKIFQNYTKLKANKDLPIEYAKELNLNIDQFITDAQSPKIDTQIKNEIKQMRSLKVRQAVPKYFINNREYNGQRSLQGFSTIINQLLKQSNK